jgi:chromosome segregation ATPase
MRFDPSVNYGAIMQAGTILVLAIFGYATYTNQTAQTARDLTATRAEMKESIAGLEKSVSAGQARTEAKVDAGLTAIQSQIRDLPDLGARTTQLERRLDGADNRMRDLETRLGRVADTVTETRAEVTSMSRASDVPLRERTPARATR